MDITLEIIIIIATIYIVSTIIMLIIGKKLGGK